MGTPIPTDSTGDHRVPGERALFLIGRLSLAVVGLVAYFALIVLYAWAITLVVTHAGDGVGGIFAWLLVVAMGALGIAAISASCWAILQNPALRRRFR